MDAGVLIKTRPLMRWGYFGVLAPRQKHFGVAELRLLPLPGINFVDYAINHVKSQQMS